MVDLQRLIFRNVNILRSLCFPFRFLVISAMRRLGNVQSFKTYMFSFWAFCHECDPGWRVPQTLDVYMANCHPGWQGYPTWQTGQPTLVGYPTYHVNVIPHLDRLPNLPRVPHLHVNRPYLPIVILLTVCHTILMMLVRRICYWINLNNPLNDTFLYSHHFFA